GVVAILAQHETEYGATFDGDRVVARAAGDIARNRAAAHRHGVVAVIAGEEVADGAAADAHRVVAGSAADRARQRPAGHGEDVVAVFQADGIRPAAGGDADIGGAGNRDRVVLAAGKQRAGDRAALYLVGIAAAQA